MQSLKIIPRPHDPRETLVVTANPKAFVIAKMRALVDRLERGETRGLRSQWIEPDENGCPSLVFVEAHHDGSATLHTVRFAAPSVAEVKP